MTAQAEREAKRNTLILAASQAFVGAASPIAVSMGGLAGYQLLAADKSLSTAPVTGFTVGIAIGALPAAAIMRRAGRRFGFVFGSGVTAMGGAIAAAALFNSSFWLFVLGLLFIGMGSSFVQQYRFAAADNAPDSFKPKAISWVLSGGIFAAIIGPQTAIHTRELLSPVMFAGAFVGIIGLSAIGATILSFLRLTRDQIVETADDSARARPLGQIVQQPRFISALVCAVGSYTMMTFVMTGAPLAMVGCGFSPDEATLGISWHVMAMFAPSFFTGRLIARFGKEKIIVAGLTLLMVCAGVALSGIELWQFWTALILLGIGWNFGFIGATSIVTECYRPSEKNKVQGLHDFVLFSLVAFSSLMSGQVYNIGGWALLNWIVIPVTLLCLAALGYLIVSDRKVPITS